MNRLGVLRRSWGKIVWMSMFGAVMVFSGQLSVRNSFADVTVVREQTDQGVLVVYKMTVTPAAESVPAMKYRLTVDPIETRPGNAITYYLRSFGENSLRNRWKIATDRIGDEVHDWYSYEMAIKDLPLDKVREVSDLFDSYVENHIDRATLCRDADWGLAEEDLTGMEAIEFLLPSVQQTRSISRMLALRTRLAIAEGRYTDAIDEMRMNYQLGQNVSKMKFLVSNLVGIAEIGIAHNTVIDLIGAPDSPNMFWALAELPRPLIGLRDSIRLELSIGIRLIPELRDVESDDHSVEEWSRILRQTQTRMLGISSLTGAGDSDEHFANSLAGFVGLTTYSPAKKRLIQQGMDQDRVEAMAVGQVLLIDMVREYRRLANLYERSLYVPFRQAKQMWSEAETELDCDRGQLSLGITLAQQLLPAIMQVRQAQVRIEWQRNAMQVVEAIRMHLAETGKLPASLDEITAVPLPLNPFTGKPYIYTFDGQKARIELPFGEHAAYAMRFEIQRSR